MGGIAEGVGELIAAPLKLVGLGPEKIRPPEAPDPEEEAARQARRASEAADRAMRARNMQTQMTGRASTILTGNTQGNTTNPARRALFGG